MNSWLRWWKSPVMFIYSWIPVISPCKCTPALSLSKHLSTLSVSQGNNTICCSLLWKNNENRKDKEKPENGFSLLIYLRIFAFNKESYGKVIFGYQLWNKRSNIAEWTFGFSIAGGRKTSTCAQSKNKEHMCLGIFMFGRGVQGEGGLERVRLKKESKKEQWVWNRKISLRKERQLPMTAYCTYSGWVCSGRC